MQVFTTIYLAEEPPANLEGVEDSWRLDHRQPAPDEYTLRQRIAMLENRNWFEDDDTER